MLDDVVGREYGPVSVPLAGARIAEYVAATTDDPHRWIDHAPPAYAGALLFAIAPDFLSDPEVAPVASMVIHGEQTFEWHEPLAAGTTVQLRGSLERVRERGGVAFANFALTAESQGRPILTARSTFLMSGEAPPGGDGSERPEPPPSHRSPVDVPACGGVAVDGTLPRLDKSASRADLIRYAGASGDFNPVHWDHELAVAAGLGGVVVHGLLVAAWAMQPATCAVPGPRPLARARIRFRSPLYPAIPAYVTGRCEGPQATVAVGSTDGEHVTARFELAQE